MNGIRWCCSIYFSFLLFFRHKQTLIMGLLLYLSMHATTMGNKNASRLSVCQKTVLLHAINDSCNDSKWFFNPYQSTEKESVEAPPPTASSSVLMSVMVLLVKEEAAVAVTWQIAWAPMRLRHEILNFLKCRMQNASVPRFGCTYQHMNILINILFAVFILTPNFFFLSECTFPDELSPSFVAG